jgi:hypothetical protein
MAEITPEKDCQIRKSCGDETSGNDDHHPAPEKGGYHLDLSF